MQNTLVSFIGKGAFKDRNLGSSGGYIKTKYISNDPEALIHESSEVTFVTKALYEFYHFDKIIIIGTKGSTWTEVASNFVPLEFQQKSDYIELVKKLETKDQNLTHEELVTLAEICSKALKDVTFVFKLFDDQDDFSLFNSIIESIEANDLITIDVTHGFRTIPMFCFSAIQYLTFVNNIEIKRVVYGKFEGVPRDAPKPIINLSTMLTLNKWISSFAQYNKTNDLSNFSELLSNTKYTSKPNLDLVAKLDQISFNEKVTLASHSLDLLKDIDVTKELDQSDPILRLFTKPLQERIDYRNEKTLAHSIFKLARKYIATKDFTRAILYLHEALMTNYLNLGLLTYDLRADKNWSPQEQIEIIDQIKNHPNISDFVKEIICNNVILGKASFKEFDDLAKHYYRDQAPKNIGKLFVAINTLRNGLAHGTPDEHDLYYFSNTQRLAERLEELADIADYLIFNISTFSLDKEAELLTKIQQLKNTSKKIKKHKSNKNKLGNNIDKSVFICLYSNELYAPNKVILPNENVSNFLSPSLATFEYLVSEEITSFDYFIVVGSKNANWYKLVLDFKKFFYDYELDFSFADQIENDNSNFSLLNSVDRKLFSLDEIVEIENQINEVLKENFNFSLKILIQAQELEYIQTPTKIFEELDSNINLFEDRSIYFDLTSENSLDPLIFLIGLQYLSFNHSKINIKNIYYSQCSKLSNEFFIRDLNSQLLLLKEYNVYEAIKKSASLKPLLDLIDEPQLKNNLSYFIALLSLQNYSLAQDYYELIIPRLIEYFDNSTIFTIAFFAYFKDLLFTDQAQLILRSYESNNFYKTLGLLSSIKKFEPKLQDQVNNLFYSLKIDHSYSLEDLQKSKGFLKSIIDDYKISPFNTIQQDYNAQGGLLVSFLDARDCKPIRYTSDEFGLVETKFLGNSLAKLLSNNNSINRFLVCGTYTSSWLSFIDQLIEQYHQAEYELNQVKELFLKYKDKSLKSIDYFELNRDAITEINIALGQVKDLINLKIEIFVFDFNQSFDAQINAFSIYISCKIVPNSNLYINLSDLPRELPSVLYLVLISIAQSTKANLKKIFYGSVDHNQESGTIIELTNFVETWNKIQNFISIINFSDLHELISSYQDYTAVVQNIQSAIEYEQVLAFKNSSNYFCKAEELLKTIQFEDPCLKLLTPWLINELDRSCWDGSLQSLLNKAQLYLNKFEYAKVLVILLTAYHELFHQFLSLDLEKCINNFKDPEILNLLNNLLEIKTNQYTNTTLFNLFIKALPNKNIYKRLNNLKLELLSHSVGKKCLTKQLNKNKDEITSIKLSVSQSCKPIIQGIDQTRELLDLLLKIKEMDQSLVEQANSN